MILKYNLQFFAAEGPGGEKTEPATEKKLSDARKEGQVAKSREVGNALGILAMFVVLKVFIGTIGTQLMELFSSVYGNMPETVKSWNGYLPEKGMRDVFFQIFIKTIYVTGPIFVIFFLIAFIADLVQVKWKVSGKPLKPKFNRMSPVSGFKRIFSVNSLVELIKAILKIGLISYVAYQYLKNKVNQIYLLYDMSFTQALSVISNLITEMGIRISAMYCIIAAADFAYQKVKFTMDMRMTKQEVKDEYKEQEGDPQIKGKIRQKMQEVSRRRMMQNLPKADVVITNPTHYAVAIQYDLEIADAPIVLAKGADYMAKRIKEVARENEIEIVENKPLARMLYANVEVGDMIPPELYQAVADVLAYVYHLKGRA